MLPAVLLLQLALWALSTSAFYPYTPLWLKEKEDLTLFGEAKRSLAVAESRDGLTLRIEKKKSQGNDSPALLAAKQAAWLKDKFKHTRSGTPVEAVEKRENSFNIKESTESGETMATGIHQDGTDYSYFLKAGLGSKGKQVYLLIDTGAGSTWVMGSDCKSTSCSQHTTFGQGDSSTLIDADKSFSVSYGAGSVQGNLVTDTISVGNISLTYTFGLASKTSDEFSRFAFDGILGMSMGQGKNDNFLKSLAEAKKLDKNLFGIRLNRASDGLNNGEIMLGSINPKYAADLKYTPIGSKNGDWAIQIDDMAYDGKKAGAGGVLSYIDTGTSFIFGPPSLVKKIHETIPESSSPDGRSYTVPCDINKPLSFTFSGVDYQISAQDWISPKNSSGQCTSNLYGHEVVNGAWLLGDTFLKNVYSVFDADQKRIGFAVLADSKSESSSISNSGSSSPTPTTVGSTTVTETTLTTGVTSQPDFSTQSQQPPRSGLGGHETGSTGSGSATAKPTESTKSAASDVSSQQNVNLAVMMFFAALTVLVA